MEARPSTSATLQFQASRPPAGERLAEQVGSIRLKVEHDVLHSTLIARGDTRNCMAMILKPHGFEYNRNLKRWERAGAGPEAVLAGMQRIAERDGVSFETFRTNEPVRKRSLADFLAEHEASCTAALASDLQDPHGTDEEIDDEWDDDALAQIDAAVAAHAAAPRSPAAAAAPRPALTPEQQRRIEANKAEALRRRAAAGAAPVATAAASAPLTPEQQRRIEANRAEALRRRAAASSSSSQAQSSGVTASPAAAETDSQQTVVDDGE